MIKAIVIMNIVLMQGLLSINWANEVILAVEYLQIP